MNLKVGTGLLVGTLTLILFALPAWAGQSQGVGWQDPDDIGKEGVRIFTVIAIFLVLAFVGVAGYLITGTLADAKENGRFGRVGLAIVFVFLAGFTLWTLMARSGQDPNSIVRKIQTHSR